MYCLIEYKNKDLGFLFGLLACSDCIYDCVGSKNNFSKKSNIKKYIQIHNEIMNKLLNNNGIVLST